MALHPGTRLGPYEVVAPLGAGGMGEVYRARDTRLKRDVALKILPSTFAADADRLARFQREAEVLASLTHPHIAAIYGVEGTRDGGQALVLELVEGETLAEQIARGPIPIDEAIRLARQIAEALEAAHEHGVIHRDLKPANIKVTPDGIVKVLDFGLAKLAVNGPNGPNDPNDPNGPHLLSMSPTLASPAVMATGVGVILGTAAYMAPEQAKGRAADKRTDIWAFGCVLYEMLTGRRPFDGEDVADMMAAVLRGEPDWSALPATLPASIRTLLQRALAKERRQRFGDFAAALVLLDQVARTSIPVASRTAPVVAPARSRQLFTAALAAAVIAAVTWGATWYLVRPAPPRVTRTTVTLPRQAAVSPDGLTRDAMISWDGRTIAYVGGPPAALFVRPLDRLLPSPVTVGGPFRHPALSADGQWIAFFDAANALRKVATTGGAPQLLVANTAGARGVSWVHDDALIFATIDSAAGLMRVSAGGGELEVLTRPNRQAGEIDHVWPELLPGGTAVLFTVQIAGRPADQAQIAVLDLQTRTWQTLIHGGSHAQYVPPGYLVFGAAGALRAVRFDARRLQVIGTPVPVLEGVNVTTQGAVNASVSADGTLVYLTGAAAAPQRTMVWVDRRGVETPTGAPARAYLMPRLSPDGTRIAVHSLEQDDDLWLWEVDQRRATRATFDPTRDFNPVWTPDGGRLIWTSARNGVLNIYTQSADGTGAVERLTDGPNGQTPTSVTPDGGRLIFHETRSATGTDLMVLTLDRTRAATVLLATVAAERNGEISPDGRWLAYESDESGQLEIYVRPFPNVDGGKWQVSAEGGTRPAWAKRGNELFYRAPDGAIVATPVATEGARFRAGTPVPAIPGGYTMAGFTQRHYDVAPNGQRFLMLKDVAPNADAASSPSIVVVQHWVEELKRIVGN